MTMVRCLEEHPELTLLWHYLLLRETGAEYIIINDNHEEAGYSKNMFRKVER